MKRFLMRLVIVLVAAVAALYVVGPYEESDLATSFDEGRLDQGVAAYLAFEEGKVPGITPGVEKRVIWAGAAEEKAPWAVLYLHGFSATSEETRPVPDKVAEGLGANLIYTRLAGHGQDGAALAEASVADWMRDLAEGLAIARRIGDRVLVISASTGGTLATAAAVDPRLNQELAGVVLISPNFGIQNPLAPLLTWPAARYWLPQLAGAERAWEPRNEAHGKYWTTSYPSVAALPMAALVQEVAALDVGQAEVPALFIYSDDDTVVRPDLTAERADQWGGPVTVVQPVMSEGDDPDAHVIAGDIMSPGQNAETIAAILEWAQGL